MIGNTKHEYRAPEIWKKEKRLCDREYKRMYQKSDMWSFGCTLFELCYLQKAFLHKEDEN